MRSPKLLLALGLTALLSGCSSSDDSAESSDALERRSFWADAKALNLDDLGALTAKYATDAFNSALDDRIGARVETYVYGKEAEPNRILPNRAEVRSLADLVSNLENRLGGTELGTQLNKTRLKTLESGAAKYFVESAFTFNAGIGHDWSFESGGIVDGNMTIGLNAGTSIESRLIVATTDDRLEAMVDTPIAAAKAMRGSVGRDGFVMPRSFEEVQAMVPGESFMLRGSGRLATNLGLGVPVFVGAAGPVGYQLVVSAGVGGVFEGELDVQLMRLEGNEVVVDVGVQNVKSFKVHAAVEDKWGIKGICDDGAECLREHMIGGKQTPLHRLVERTVDRKLKKHFGSRVGFSYEKDAQRFGLTRVRFNLGASNRAEVEKALAQALKFDLRYAEALSNRDLDVRNAPVRVEFDALRSSSTTTFDFGVRLLGMDIYDRVVVKRTGTFVLQSPEGATLLSYDAMDKSKKSLQTTNGIRRIAIGARTTDAQNPGTWRSDANLIVRTSYGDTHIHDDRFLDGMDAVIGGLGGAPALAAIDGPGSTIEKTLRDSCPLTAIPGETPPPYDETCNLQLLPTFTPLRDAGKRDLAAVAGASELGALLTETGTLRLGLQSVQVMGNAFSKEGVNMSLTVDQRFDGKALDILTGRSAEDYKKALVEYLAILTVDRARLAEGHTRAAEQNAVRSRFAKKIEAMASKFSDASQKYRTVSVSEKELLGELPQRRFVSTPIGIRFLTDASTEDGELTATSRERADALVGLVDGLTEVADDNDLDLSLYNQHAAVIPLTFLVPAKNQRVGITVRTAGFEDDKLRERERFRSAGLKDVEKTASGAEVTQINLGPFDLEAALTAAKR